MKDDYASFQCSNSNFLKIDYFNLGTFQSPLPDIAKRIVPFTSVDGCNCENIDRAGQLPYIAWTVWFMKHSLLCHVNLIYGYIDNNNIDK